MILGSPVAKLKDFEGSVNQCQVAWVQVLFGMRVDSQYARLAIQIVDTMLRVTFGRDRGGTNGTGETLCRDQKLLMIHHGTVLTHSHSLNDLS
jgi:hypothetical protein